MRQVLTDHARARHADKPGVVGGEGWQKVTFDDNAIGKQAAHGLRPTSDSPQTLH